MEGSHASTVHHAHGYRVIRAKYTPTTITVYQAYSPEIADAAIRAQRFVSPFRRQRMTWIKPSFLWMAYRCGWASKPNQERVLAVEITREGFEWALRHSCLSHAAATKQEEWQQKLQSRPVRVQWDPERDLSFRPLGYRAIQVGLGRESVDRYIDDWIVSITDVTQTMKQVAQYVADGMVEEAKACLPEERVYPLSDELREILDAT
ncbi:conserved hypothetical protein [Aspergillus terreus NIH2624]|jgi:hypothetical protein|uniref:DUF4291 domain-containing protein n=1 Tax=Aspergillus terreus (strain NIH 2624 / FGSC A1156) TaxID=341663 RepID=Q0CWK0_ASPTN|nr:uncharacterized protein ATEG_01934 [Aspergillus terreus NIH2624]EAU36896.1 conserved hypothetical protein [Aspergillus terreus NIH2624]